MSTPTWGIGWRIGFRFGALVVALFQFPFPLTAFPHIRWLTDWLTRPWDWAIVWFAERALGLPAPSLVPNGSGDTTAAYVHSLLVLLVAALGTVVWSVVDRRRAAYPRLARLLWIGLRYSLAFAMLSYGFAKILKSQFPDLHPGRLSELVGEMSPMGLLWTFMGYSTAYSVFAGLAEAIGGALLLWRRTVALGAVLIAIVMANVVMLNLCFDVPVKLYATRLLLEAIVIGLPGMRRMLSAALGHAVAAVPPRPRTSIRAERIRLAAKLVVIGLMVWTLYGQFSGRPSRNARVHELYGTWQVDSYLVDGSEGALGDPDRWREISANPRALWIRPLSGRQRAYELEVDAASRTITVKRYDDDFKLIGESETWTYTRPAPDRLIIDGKHHSGQLHVELHRAPDPLLLTRGFHWINEAPFNR